MRAGVRRWARGLAATVAGALLAIAIAAGLLLGTQVGRQFAVAQALSRMPDLDGLRLGVEQLEWPALGLVSLTGLAIDGPDGRVLELQGLRLDWTPTALLRGQFRIESLTIDRLALLRLPPAGGDGDTAGFGPILPELPLAVRVGALDLRRIVVGPEVAGAEIELGGNLALRWPRAEQLELDLALRDAVGGRTTVQARVVLAPDLTLNVDATARDDERGILSGLLGLPGWPATSLSLKGGGPLADWRGQARGRVGELASLEAELGGDLSELRRFEVAASGRAAGALPALFGVPGLPDAVWTAVVVLHDLERLAIERARVEAPASWLELAGTLRADGRIEGLRATGEAARSDWAALLPPEVAFDAATVDATLSGSLTRPSAKAVLAVDRPAFDGIASLARLECDVVAEGGADEMVSAEADCRLRDAKGHPVLPVALGKAATVSLAGDFDPGHLTVRLSRLSLAGAALKLDGSMTAGPIDAAIPPPLDITLTVRSGDIAPLAAVFDAPGGGPMTLQLTGRTADDGAIAGSMTLDASPRLPPDIPGAALLGDRVRMTADYRFDPDGGLALRRARMTAGQLAATAEGRIALPDGELSASAQITIAGLERLALPAGRLAPGEARLDVTANGRPERLALTGVLTGPDVVMPEITVVAPRLDFTARLDGGDISGRADLRSRVGGRVASLGTAYDLSGDAKLKLTAIEARMPELAVDGEIEGDLRSNLWRGALTLDAASLASTAALMNLPLDGALSGWLALDHDGGGQLASVSLSAEALSFLQDETAVLVDTVAVEGRVADLFGAPTLSARAEAAGLVTPDISASAVVVSAEGGLDRMSWAMQLAAEAQAPVALEAAGTLAHESPETALEVTRLQGSLAGTQLRLSRPLSLRLGDGELTLKDLELALGEGSLSGEASMTPDALQASARAAALPLAPFAAMAGGPGAEGSLSLDGVLDWRPDRQSLTLTAEAAGLRLAVEDAVWPSGALAMRAGWEGSRLSVEGEVTGFTEEAGRFSLALPLAAGARPPEADLRQDAPLEARLRWRGEIGPLMALLPLSEHRMRGEGQLDLAVEGTPAEPRLSGSARLTGGHYEHLYWGTELANVELSAQGESGGGLKLTGSADDGGEGTLAIEGAVALDRPDRPSGWVTVGLNRFKVLDRDELRGAVSADLRGEGGLEEILLSGRTEVERMEIQISDRLPPSAVELNVREVGRPGNGAQPEGEEADAPAGPLTRLDLTVAMPARVFVRGRGLDSEWSGELHITGTSRKPDIRGELQIVRGRFGFAGRSFEISEGQLRFRGGDEVDPEIDVLIRHVRSDLRADIRLSGPVSAPELSLSSMPSLPEDEILARVVFGKSLRELSPLQSLQLAQSVAEISGTLSGGGLLGQLRQSLGLDAITVEGGEEGEGLKVGVGKYVLDNVFVGVRQGATAGSGELAAKVELTPNINLETEVGQDASSNVGLNWHLDY